MGVRRGAQQQVHALDGDAGAGGPLEGCGVKQQADLQGGGRRTPEQMRKKTSSFHSITTSPCCALQVTLYVGPFCLVAPLSILLGSVIGSVAPWAHLVLSCFATGTFLYVGASEVIMEGEETQRTHAHILEFPSQVD